MAVALRGEKLHKTFDGVRAVDDITLAVEPGELFFLLGPSGCGKTTLLRCFAGFCRPDAGRVWIGDRDVTDLPPHRRETGMVFQSYALWPHLTVAQNVAFGLEVRRVPRAERAARVARVLELVRMTDRAQRRPNELSGGQQQRVALARALVIEPQCLLLDEPLSNLDAKLRLEMRIEIRRICKAAGLTALYVTHDQKEALAMADRLAVLDGGRIQQLGVPEEVYRRPVSRFVAGFIGETNFIDGRVAAVTAAGVTVSTAAGDLVGTAVAPGLSVGQAVALSIRPECVRLAAAPAGAPNGLRGSLHHSVYMGESAQHQLTLPARAGGEAATLKVLDLRPTLAAREGAVETAAWVDPADIVVLTA